MGPLRLIFFLLCILNLVGSYDSRAQYYNPKCRNTALGFSVKSSSFDGDIVTPFQLVRPGFGIHVTRRFTPRFSYMSELMWIRVMGDDYLSSNLQSPNKIPSYIRNLHFRNDIKEISFNIKYDLFPNADHYRKRPIYNLYGLLGLSAFYHNPKARMFTDTTLTKRKWVSLKPLETENVTYSRFQIAIPVAVGIRYKLSLQWDMEIEIAYRYTFTDYLDDVNGNYSDFSELNSDLSRKMSNRTADPKSAFTGDDRDIQYIESDLGFPVVNSGNNSYVQNFGPGTERGSKKGTDRYIIFGVRFLYAIPGTVTCPRFREFE